MHGAASSGGRRQSGRAPATRPREEDATVATASDKRSAALLREARAFDAANLDIVPQAAGLKSIADGFALVHGDDDHEKGRKTWFSAPRT